MNEQYFGRDCHKVLPVAVRGEGCYLFDRDGKAYLDGSGGAAVSCFGHNNAEIKAAMHEQIDQLAFAHTGFFSSEPAERLVKQLINAAPKSLDRVYMVSGGSEAVESALKLARQYYVEIGEPERKHIISRHQSYHGNTLGALSAGGHVVRRKLYAPILLDVHHILPCFAFRHQRAEETEAEFAARAAGELEAKILHLGAENVMAFIAETVVGATIGAVPPVVGYFTAVREICDRYGVLLILDEVMCGMGRTGSMFACAQEDIVPDILTIAKGLGAGYQPVGAMLCSEAIYQAIKNGSGAFQHGHTYLGHPMAAAAASKVVEILQRPETIPTVSQQGASLRNILHETFGQHPHVADIRGRGLFMAIELVADRQNNRPFDANQKIHKRLKNAAFDAGLICYPEGGTVDGQAGDHILLAPPYIISDDEITELCQKLRSALDAVCGS